MTKLWTDYPILALGDVAGREAPIRECTFIEYDGDKYCDVLVGGVVEVIKKGYIYKKPVRCGEAPGLSHRSATALSRHALRRAALEETRHAE